MRRDPAADLGVGLGAGVGAACWASLSLGQAGCFNAPVPIGVGLATAALVARALLCATDGRWSLRIGEGVVVAVLAGLWIGHGFDTAVLGSDASVYFAAGAHLARTGALAIHDALLEQLSQGMVHELFPWFGGTWGYAARSPNGLVFAEGSSNVYFSFPQLPATWLGLGFALGGTRGECLATPFLMSVGCMAFYLLVRRTVSATAGVIGVVVLLATEPVWHAAHFPLGEAGGFCFLWVGLLALERYRATGIAVAAAVAGACLGLAVAARHEYVLFLGVALLMAGRRIPWTTIVLAAIPAAQALAHHVVVAPTHYRLWAIEEGQGVLADALGRVFDHPLPAAVGLGIGGTLLVTVGWRAGRRRLPLARTLAGCASAGLIAAVVGGWMALPPSPEAGQGGPWLVSALGWTGLAMAAAGLPVVWRAWRGGPLRLAAVLAAVATLAFLWDPRISFVAEFGSRRLVPMVLPACCAALGAGVVVVGRRSAIIAGVLALCVLWGAVSSTASVRGPQWYAGVSDGVGRLAASVPADAIVVLDGNLRRYTLEVPLLLRHDLAAIGLQRLPSDVGLLLLLTIEATSLHRPVYLVRPAGRSPGVPLLGFQSVARVDFPVLEPTVPLDEPQAAQLVALEVDRVTFEPAR